MALIRRGLSLPTQTAGTYFTEQQLRDYLLALAKQRYEGQFGQTVPVNTTTATRGCSERRPTSKPPARSGRYRTPTPHVDGVDEADFVETDATTSTSPHTVSSRSSAPKHVVATVPLSGNVVGQFLSGNRLTVIHSPAYGGCCASGPSRPGRSLRGALEPADHGHRLRHRRPDPRRPRLPAVSTTAYRDARAVDGVVHVVLDSSIKLPEPLYTDTPVKGAPVV